MTLAPTVTGAVGTSAPRRHILTVALEDYFQVGTLRHVIPAGHWPRFERRIERNTRATLDLLDAHAVKATFFALGWLGDTVPELLHEVARRGHEVACKGYYHRALRQMDRGEFREDAARAREALERATGQPVRGYRIAQRWFGPEDLWALDALAEQGFVYDSSLRPIFRSFADQPFRRFAHVHEHAGRRLWEFPLSTWQRAGWAFPIAGGNYHRQFPNRLMQSAIARWDQECDHPFLLYFHVWDLDPDQPRITAAPLLERIRQYRNLDKMEAMLGDYFGRYRFTGIADWLDLPRPAPAASAVPPVPVPLAVAPAATAVPITVVVPCYNEEATLPYLANTLEVFEADLAPHYAVRYVLVDDGSGDATWERLSALFGDRPECHLVRLPANRGIAAAVLAGIEHARTEIVCTIDCDCTYDPRQLKRLLPRLEDGVDLVTASPYHAAGTVTNVPAWRLVLSRSLSRLYRGVLRHKLATYTSCFRVYRRTAVLGLTVREDGFLGIAEILARIDRRGGRIVEVPAVLEARLLGTSKMKVLRTIAGHLRLLAWLALARRSAIPPPDSPLPGSPPSSSPPSSSRPARCPIPPP